MERETILKLAHLRGVIQTTEAILKAQLDFAGKLQQQLDHLQRQYSDLQEVGQ
ncbi:MAG: hypothetical protein PHN92_07555 [Geobacter sp.]|nr:hypothetical protein [Geobacter sp.]